MSSHTLADHLEVGDLVELSTRSGTHTIRLDRIEPRLGGIKFVGRDTKSSQVTSFGMKYGQPAVLLSESDAQHPCS